MSLCIQCFKTDCICPKSQHVVDYKYNLYLAARKNEEKWTADAVQEAFINFMSENN